MNHRQIFLTNQAQTSNFPLAIEMEYAKGVYQVDVDGKEYLDLISGIGVSSVGHAHPVVVDAIAQQAAKYQHLMVYGEFIQHPQTKLANSLVELLPDELSSIYFVNSGTEATEGAMKIAKKFTGRSSFVAFSNAYHGSTQGALSLMGSDDYKAGYGPLLPNITHLEYNKDSEFEAITEDTAAVFVEVVQAESGIQAACPWFLYSLERRCKEVGALLVFDEIQTGIGRTGSMFAFERYGIIPDILLLAKGLGGGLPIGAFISSPEIMNVIKENPILGHITTYGGNAVCCAAANAVLDVIQSENLVENVTYKALLFRSKLRHPKIKQIRNAGLMMALQFDNFEQTKRIVDGCLNDGVITDWFLYSTNCLRIAPPLIITESEIEQACSIILRNIEQYG